MANQYKVVTSNYAPTFKKVQDGIGKTKNNEVLMGSYVLLLPDESPSPGWQKVKAFGIEGWMEAKHLDGFQHLKIFYVDVGQGDGALLEVGTNESDKVMKILIDGGPSDNLSRYLSKWQYKYYFDKNERVEFDFVFISHFDKDHYQGLIDIINDEHYSFGTIYHNGIAKFSKAKSNFPKSEYNTELGKKEPKEGESYLITGFDSLDDLTELKTKGGMIDLFEKFVFAVQNASAQGRIKKFIRADVSTAYTATHNQQLFQIDILAPVQTEVKGKLLYKYFKDESHTINGHSIVIKITYGECTFLFGGDLNTDAELHLINHYGDNNPFEVDVAKACHHGSSEFTTDFMNKVNPFVTVISSGDNESFSHPRADAVGCAGKYSKSDRPLVFSTELARSSNVKTDSVKYGMINLRCDGKEIIMAQMKEAAKSGQVWDLYEGFVKR